MSGVKWIIRDENIPLDKVIGLMNEIGCGYLLASVLCSRGYAESGKARELISGKEVWHDPMLLPDIALAINRIKSAKAKKELVAVYGDYDADGITATVIMQRCLEEFGVSTVKYIPDRGEEGYGLNKNAIEELKQKGVSLIVTVDCGIASIDEINFAFGLGIDTIVTDHHNCPEQLPRCTAVVNPKRKDSIYPFKNLAGAGVAYKFACALIGVENAENFLELAAIGTVADVVELIDENRKIVSEGLEIINKNPSPGINALLALSSVKEADSTSLAFVLSPRINCAGRIESPESAYRLLTAKTIEDADFCAKKLNELNRKRQLCEQEIYEQVVEEIKRRSLHNDDVIVAGGTGWNPGVIGIVAARITERANKPCVLITYDNDGIGRASGRSVEGFNLYEALKYCESVLVKYGGHALAAGLTIERDNEEKFRTMINNFAIKNSPPDISVKKVYIDTVIPIDAVNVENIEELKCLEPYGTGNEKPVFAITDAKISDIRELSEGKHLKFTVYKNSKYLDAIAFGYGALAKKLYNGMSVHVSGHIDINDYTGRGQMIVKDILYK